MWIEEQNSEPEVPMQSKELQQCVVFRQRDLLSECPEGQEAVQQDAIEKLGRKIERQILFPPLWPTFFGPAR
jgi:hypothetical protein